MWSAQDTAEYLGVTPDTLYRKWKEWGMVGYRIGGCLKFRGRDIEAWLEKNRAE